jgi:CheY-like chemotaxis protein
MVLLTTRQILNNSWLLVEDNEDDVLLLRRVCARLTAAPELYWARDGMEAKEYLVKAIGNEFAFLPTLILSDLNMPLLNGLELLSWVKRQERLSQIPFVILTSSTNDEHRKFASQLRVDDYLVKPGNLNGLSGLVQELQSRWSNLT